MFFSSLWTVSAVAQVLDEGGTEELIERVVPGTVVASLEFFVLPCEAYGGLSPAVAFGVVVRGGGDDLRRA
jgi:hypothetical protein